MLIGLYRNLKYFTLPSSLSFSLLLSPPFLPSSLLSFLLYLFLPMQANLTLGSNNFSDFTRLAFPHGHCPLGKWLISFCYLYISDRANPQNNSKSSNRQLLWRKSKASKRLCYKVSVTATLYIWYGFWKLRKLWSSSRYLWFCFHNSVQLHTINSGPKILNGTF